MRQYWDTGNKGATTLGASNSVPTDDTSIGTRMGCKAQGNKIHRYRCTWQTLLQGNLFAGRYVKTEGTNGILSVWQTFHTKAYQNEGATSNTTVRPSTTFQANGPTLRDKPDSCIVWVALIDSDQPYEIRTNPKNRKLFDENDPEVIAYGKMEYGQTVTDYVPFEFELEYKSTSRIPKYILITASASKYGDYFTGGTRINIIS